jgi:hypothetical protein
MTPAEVEKTIVSTPEMVINMNLFPSVTIILQVIAAVALIGGPLVLLGWAGARLVRRMHRREVAALGRSRGITDASADFLGRVFERDGLQGASTAIEQPELLLSQLARAVRSPRSLENARSTAGQARRLLEELGLASPAFDGAPAPFEGLTLLDTTDPNAPGVPAWIVAIDERNLVVVSHTECPFPLRRNLMASPRSDARDPFDVSLLLKPVPPKHEWVLTHNLVDVITNRRAALRVVCRIETWSLPESADALLLREQIAQTDDLELDGLRRSRAWPTRNKVSMLDISADGCRLAVSHPASLRQRFHVVLGRADGEIAAMPLAEVIGLQSGPGGVVFLGLRFIDMRLKERARLASYTRDLAAQAAESDVEDAEAIARVAAAADPKDARR